MTGPGKPTILPSRSDPVVRAMSTAIGGPIGRRARLGESRWWTPVRLLVLFAVIGSTLGFLQKSSCATHGYTHEYQYSRLCYTDVLALWYDEKLDAGKVPILDDENAGVVGADGTPAKPKYVEYPVVIGMLMTAAQGLTHAFVPSGPDAAQQAAIDRYAQDQATGVEQSNEQQFMIDQYRANNATAAYQTRQGRWFFDITAVILMIFAVITVVCTGLAAGRRRIWDAAMVGLCPVLILHGDVNWDLAAVAFASAGLLAWSRSRPALAGVLLGVGAATKLYPALLLIPLLALCIRAGVVRAWWKAVAGGVVAWLVLNVPYILANRQGWAYFYTFNERRGTEYNSLFYAWEYFLRGPGDPRDADSRVGAAGQVVVNHHTVMNAVSAVLLVSGLVAVFLVCLLARRRPRLGQVAFLTVLVFVLTNKVYSPQYALWLLPLFVLARPRWRLFLVWQLSELVLLVTLYAHLIHVDKAGAKGIGYAWFFALGNGPRDVILLVVAAFVLWEIAHPELDVVRADGDDDPTGGPLDGAIDRFAPDPPAPGLAPPVGPVDVVRAGAG